MNIIATKFKYVLVGPNAYEHKKELPAIPAGAIGNEHPIPERTEIILIEDITKGSDHVQKVYDTVQKDGKTVGYILKEWTPDEPSNEDA